MSERRKTKHIAYDYFVRCWIASDTLDDVVDSVNVCRVKTTTREKSYSKNDVASLAFHLRKRGVKLPYFRKGRKKLDDADVKRLNDIIANGS